MNTLPMPATIGAIPWYQSTDQKLKVATGIAVLVLAFPKSALVAKFGLANPDQVTNYINAASVVAPFVPLTWAFVARIFSKIQPLTWGAKSAAVHPATVAVLQTQAAMTQAGIPPTALVQARIEAEQAVVAVHPQNTEILSSISPEVVSVIAKAVVAALAARQAQAKAAKDAAPSSN